MKSYRSQFLGLFVFLSATTLVLTNGFVARIFAQENGAEIVTKIEPIAVVLDEIMKHYVENPDADKVIEGALIGMMNSLDDHSSYVPPQVYQEITEDTEGEFDGIGVQIKLDDDKNIVIFHPLPASPAAKAGLMGNDIIVKIDGISTEGMSLDEAKDLIRGARGTVVHLTVFRQHENEEANPELLEIDVTRGRIPLESVMESRVLDGRVGYVRISDFKKTTAHEISSRLKELEEEGMRSLILDLRWNPGGLLSASKDVAELFLPKGTKVTYTKGRHQSDGTVSEEITLYTERDPILPENFPMVLLVNEQTASSSEIVTGALQFYERALVVGMKTFGKGSVQTIIPLRRPKDSALRLTTALYYTPADVTINKHGILPDVEVPLPMEQWRDLFLQMRESWETDPAMQNQQNHGSVTGDTVDETTVEDVQLKRAVEILQEDAVWENLLKRYHKDTAETQVAAAEAKDEAVSPPVVELEAAQ
ncbi:MAG: S41 family peptidase [Candidatus Hydrogenedentes bacterium]|nr:S41 family peptidase [Candidatus Hydrogenedentota bacterium]